MAYSQIEERYLSALTAVQFPDAPVEAQAAAPEPMMLAAAGDVPVTGEIKPIEQTDLEKALEAAGIGLEQAGRFLDSLGQVKVPGTDISLSLADLVPFVGSAKDRSVFGTTWQGTPRTLQKLGTGVGPMVDRVTTGKGVARQLDEDAKLTAAELVPMGAAKAGKVVRKASGAAAKRAEKAAAKENN